MNIKDINVKMKRAGYNSKCHGKQARSAVISKIFSLIKGQLTYVYDDVFIKIISGT